jgi:hypothetical protein
MDLTETGYDYVGYVHAAPDTAQWRALVTTTRKRTRNYVQMPGKLEFIYWFMI